MCGVRKLTYTAYANQRMTLYLKIAKILMSKRNTMTALRGQSTDIRRAKLADEVGRLSGAGLLLKRRLVVPLSEHGF